MKPRIYTIGHSTRDMEEFLHILKTYKITQLVDVRTLPGSRKFPQYDKENMEVVLPKNGIAYNHKKNLGGLRKTHKESINMGWRNTSFRAYADYMQTDEFTEALQELMDLTEKDNTVIMCAEAVPWRCHRSFIGDALLIRDYEVLDIFSDKKTQAHKLTSFAVVDGLKITYPEYETE